MSKFLHKKSDSLTSSPNIRKVLFYIIFSMLSILIILFIFLSLILLLVPLRHRIPYDALPWLYLGIYFVATLISFILLKTIFNKGKKIFFRSSKTNHNPASPEEKDAQ